MVPTQAVILPDSGMKPISSLTRSLRHGPEDWFSGTSPAARAASCHFRYPHASLQSLFPGAPLRTANAGLTAALGSGSESAARVAQPNQQRPGSSETQHLRRPSFAGAGKPMKSPPVPSAWSQD